MLMSSRHKCINLHTVVKLLGRLGVKVEVLEELWGPVLLVPLTEAALPSQVAPGVLQLEETPPLHNHNQDQHQDHIQDQHQDPNQGHIGEPGTPEHTFF